MDDLKDALNVLYELKELRERAKELREQGRRSLKEIGDTGAGPGGGGADPEKKEFRERWISSDNSVEAALLVKVQNHRDMSEDDDENDTAEASPSLKRKLRELEIDRLFPPSHEALDGSGDRAVSVLVAARVMQALVMRSETVFSRATMLCYYRIVRELYIAAEPDWTIGAARAGAGGNTSAFITGECIRAIFAFQDVLTHTATFFKQTSRLHGRYELLKAMCGVLQTESLAVGEYADRAIERMWFDWYISTHPRRGNMGLHLGAGENELLFQPDKPAGIRSVGEYLDGLREKMRQAVEHARGEIAAAKAEIITFRKKSQGDFFVWKREDGNLVKRPSRKMVGKDREYQKRLRDYDRAESAHQFALSLIEKAESEAAETLRIIDASPLKDILFELSARFRENATRVQRVLEPAKRYIRTVLNREVAASAFGRFDAGELVFAAASFGAITGWKPSELLARACSLLVEALPESGRLPTTRPFHSTMLGHRMLPIGCEMTRGLAQLLQKTDFEIEPKLVRRMLNIFEEKLIRLDSPRHAEKGEKVAWNFEGAPDPNKPCVWVTAVSVLAIDRVVRMLNERINSTVFDYFEVIKPEKPHSTLTLNDLVYPDLGLSLYYGQSKPSMAIRLEQMRAHVTRVTLPKMYRDARDEKEKVYSAIFYGPPGTGKTTLVEALALTSGVPLIRLSTSDLVVQGPAEIEGRARTVFEALSMLTRVVIIFDEFEVVVGVRRQSGTQKEGEVFEFLRTGMLPKLVKLHDSANRQSFAYCLATNFLAKIDPAAKRRGRFDLLTPVYDPDPLSRAGTLLYRLWRVAQRLEKDGDSAPADAGRLSRFVEVVELTSATRANRLAEDYFRLPKWVVEHGLKRPAGYKAEIPVFWYILTSEDEGYTKKRELLEEEKRKTQKEQKKARPLSDEEKEERRWLSRYEEQIKRVLEGGAGGGDILSCLVGPPAQAAAAAPKP